MHVREPRTEPIPDPSSPGVAAARTLDELAGLLRALRRRHARRRRDRELSYRDIAARTGWSHTAIGEYFTGRTLPPIDRFDALVGLLGATPAEQGALATARDRVAEHRRDARPEVRRLPVSAPAASDRLPDRLSDRLGWCGERRGRLDTEPVTAVPLGGVVCGDPRLAPTRCRLVLAPAEETDNRAGPVPAMRGPGHVRQAALDETTGSTDWAV